MTNNENRHLANDIISADQKLKANLALIGLPIRVSYRPGEVCALLGIAPSTFWRLLRAYDRDEHGRLRTPNCLESSVLRTHRRVAYSELVDYLRRNDGAHRGGDGL